MTIDSFDSFFFFLSIQNVFKNLVLRPYVVRVRSTIPLSFLTVYTKFVVCYVICNLFRNCSRFQIIEHGAAFLWLFRRFIKNNNYRYSDQQ